MTPLIAVAIIAVLSAGITCAALAIRDGNRAARKQHDPDPKESQ